MQTPSGPCNTLDTMTPELKNLLELTVLVAAALGGATAIWRLIWLPLIRTTLKVKGFFKRLCDGLDKISVIDNRVQALELQFKRNGGSSIKDDLESIKERLGYIENLVSVQMEEDAFSVFISNVRGENSYVNRTYCRMLGCTKEEILNLGWRSFIHADKSESYEHLWKEAFESNRQVEVNLPMVKTDGTNIKVHLSIFPLNKAGDKNRRFLGKIRVV